MTQPADAGRALDSVADVGPYFHTATWAAGQGWRPLSELLDGSGALAERVDSATKVLAGLGGLDPRELQPRVVASTVHLGLVARLTSPSLATLVLHGVVPALTVESLWWQPVPGGPWPIAVGPDPAAGSFGQLIESVVADVNTAFASRYQVSSQILWGNVASGLTGAQKMLAQARPDSAAVGRTVLADLLDEGALGGTIDHRGVRRSCCLFYRLPGGGYCGDCVLAHS